MRRGVCRFVPVAVLIAIGAISAAELRAQQRIFARVTPNATAASGSADLYDPGTGRLSRVSVPGFLDRSTHTATLLSDGRILIAGGFSGAILDSAQIYNDADGSLVNTSSLMTVRRSYHTATRLNDGKVLFIGGYNGSYLNSAEVYDPYFDTFTKLESTMASARGNHTATLLKDGKVLVTGGFTGDNAAELYDPQTSAFKITGNMTSARRDHTETLLPDGKVLIVGGITNTGDYLSTAETYDPATGTFATTAKAMSAARAGHTATLLANGKVLIAGGYSGSYLNTAEIYDPATRSFSAAGGNLNAARAYHSAAVLTGGRVLLSGGGGSSSHLNSLEIYDEAGGKFTAVSATMSEARSTHTATTLSNGRVVLWGGLRQPLLTFDVNADTTDNISPNMVFSADSRFGYVPYTGSGVVLVFSTKTGEIVQKIATGGKPFYATLLPDKTRFLVVSALDSRIFLINMATNSLVSTYTFTNASFGFGSIVTLSPDGATGYVSSTGTGEVIKFTVADGKEAARLKGVQAPAQITVTKDGATLLVVDALTEELVFATASSMTVKTSLKARTKEAAANFTIFNKAVLSPGGESGIIASRDNNGVLGSDTAFIFSTSTGDVLDTEKVGSEPGFTAVTPDGKYWVILNDLSLSVLPTTDPKSIKELQTTNGGPIGSASLAFSPDSRYVFYASSDSDLAFQHDLTTGAVVGKVLTGDDPNVFPDQPSTVDISPDGKTVAVINFRANSIDLLQNVTYLDGAKFTGSSLTFSGLSLVNLSAQPAHITITAFNNYGELMTGPGMNNPAVFDIPANGQLTQTAQEIFGLNPQAEYAAHFQVASDQTDVVGYLSIGEARLTYFGFFLQRMSGAPLLREPLYDFIVPETSGQYGATVELDWVNRNFNQGSYDVKRYGVEGSVIGSTSSNVAYPTNRLAQFFNDVFPAPEAGRVLIVGGETSTAGLSTAEIYNPDLQLFQSTGSMAAARADHTATVLPDGTVLIVGGRNSNISVNTAEVYDRTNLTFSATTGSMVTARDRHTATLLERGKVLIAGGQSSGTPQTNAEIFDPGSGSFTATPGEMSVARYGHTATRLPDGRVLIAGGSSGSTSTTVAELFDPATGRFTATGAMNTARAFHIAILLPNGKVLVAGGHDGTNYLNSSELFDPASGTFKASGTMTSTRQDHAATFLADGRVFIAGGYNGSALNTAEIYDPATASFAAASSTMSTARRRPTATLLPDGKVLIVGGTDGTNSKDTAELFDPGKQSFAATSGNMGAARSGHSAVFLETGKDGYLRVTSNGGLIFTEYYSGPGWSAMMNGLEVSRNSGVNTLYALVPKILPKTKAILNVINATDQIADLTLWLHKADGDVAAPGVKVNLFKGAQLKADLATIFGSGLSFDSVSYVEIQSSTDRVVGTMSIANPDESLLTSYELSGKPLADFVFPMGAADGYFKTGLALLNSGSDNAIVTVELWGPEGTKDRTTTLTIKPGAIVSGFLEDLYPALQSRTIGNVRVRSDRPIHGISIVTDANRNFLAPVAPLARPSAQN